MIGDRETEDVTFKEGPIDGVIVRPVTGHADARGWLAELYREDELDPMLRPVMAYASLTRPGVCRGPHEHEAQTDYFCFVGPSRFKIVLWDHRKESSTYRHRVVVHAGEGQPAVVLVPPGVVHAYRNVGETDGLVINCPNRLYRGVEKSEPVDEIRHEADPDTPFRVDF